MGGVMGMCICNDRRWPETYRVMSLKGVELVMLGYNTPDVNTSAQEPNHLRMFHNHVVVQASAYQNSCFLVATAKAGIERSEVNKSAFESLMRITYADLDVKKKI